MRSVLRSVASVFMLGIVGLLGAAIVLAVAVALGVALTAGGVWAIAAEVALVALVVAAGVGLFAGRRRRTGRVGTGVSITTEEQPLLWVEVYRVAEGLGFRPPDELMLTPDAKVAVSEHGTWLGLRPGVRRLHMGLPVMAGLTERQVRALIAHELCRYWGSNSTARVIYRSQGVIGRVADRVGDDSLLGGVVGRYGRGYLALSHPLNRKHELEADRLSADLAGNGATIAALRELAVLSVGWDAFVDGYADPAAAVGRRPADLFAGFTCFLDEPGRREQLAGSADGSELSSRSTYDSQPSLADRLAAIEALPDDELHDKSGPALGMLRNPDHVIRRVEESMYLESGFAPATWEDIVPEAGSAAAREDAHRLRNLAAEGGLGPTLSVATLLELLRHGLVDEMVRPLLAEGASAEAERQTAARLVTGFLATAAIESGTASYRFSWATPRQLVDGQGAVDDLPALVEAALGEGNDISAIGLWLTAHHVGQQLELSEEVRPNGDDQEAGADQSPVQNETEDPAPQLVGSSSPVAT